MQLVHMHAASHDRMPRKRERVHARARQTYTIISIAYAMRCENIYAPTSKCRQLDAPADAVLVIITMKLC